METPPSPAIVIPEFNLPDGYFARPARLEDAEALSRIYDEEDAEVGIVSQTKPEDIRTEWTVPTHALAHNSHIITDQNGTVVASVNLWTFVNPPVRMWFGWTVDIPHRHKGIEDALFQWITARAGQQIDDCPPDTRVVLHASAWRGHTFRHRLYEKMNWQVVRHFMRMKIDMNSLPPLIPLPTGYHFETYRHPDDIREMISVVNEAFRDHWGYVESPLEESVEELMHEWGHNPLFDPSLFVCVREDATHKMVGVIWNFLEESDDPTVAYSDEVSVLREHRGKGIAQAMLNHSFRALYERGRKSSTLYVDADSLTGALRLYEKVGMYQDRVSVRYEWVLREGISLMTQELA